MKSRTKAFILCVSMMAALLVSSCNKAKPLTASDYLSLGERFLIAFDYEQAVVYFQNLIEIDPTNPRGYTGLSQSYIGLNKIDDAIAALKQGFEILSNDDGFLEQLIEIYEEIIDKAPDNPDGYIGLFDVYDALGKKELAAIVLNRGLERLKYHPRLSALLAILTQSTITPTPTATTTLTPAPASTATPAPTPTTSTTTTTTTSVPTTTVTPTITPTPAVTPTVTSTITPTPAITPTITPTPVITQTPTVTPTPTLAAPTINVSNQVYRVDEGSSLHIKVNLTGSKPLNITVQGRNESNVSVPGFSVDQGTDTYIYVEPGIPAGVYTLTAMAINDAGSMSTTFLVEVLAKAPALVAPSLSVGAKSYRINAGGGTVTLDYSITGTEPVSVSLQVYDQSGMPSSWFSLRGTKTVDVSPGALPGSYNMVLTATNGAGSNSASLTLDIIVGAPALVAPTFTIKGTSFSLFEGGGTVSLGYTLSGTEPINVSLQAFDASGMPASGFSMGSAINSIRVAPDVAVSVYTVTITASNDGGTNSASFNISIKSRPVKIIG